MENSTGWIQSKRTTKLALWKSCHAKSTTLKTKEQEFKELSAVPTWPTSSHILCGCKTRKTITTAHFHVPSDIVELVDRPKDSQPGTRQEARANVLKSLTCSYTHKPALWLHLLCGDVSWRGRENRLITRRVNLDSLRHRLSTAWLSCSVIFIFGTNSQSDFSDG